MRAPEFWRAPRFWGSGGGAAATLLAPLSAIYDVAGRARRALVTPVRVTRPVICVGNLTAGGAGKTPVVLALARHLGARGLSPHLLTRGYGGSARGPLRVDPVRHTVAEVGDEALLLARAAPTWLARDRVGGANAAIAAGAGSILMDDGLQNPYLAKDISLVVVDGGYGFGNGRVIPAGPLREPVARGLARAQGVVLIGTDTHGLTAPLARHLPVLEASLEPTPDAAALRGRRVVAFAGLGRPEKFFQSLAALGATLAASLPFPDHHVYRPAELDHIMARATALDAIPVTTEKDQVRLPAPLRDEIAVLRIALAWRDEAALDRLLAPVLDGVKARRAES